MKNSRQNALAELKRLRESGKTRNGINNDYDYLSSSSDPKRIKEDFVDHNDDGDGLEDEYVESFIVDDDGYGYTSNHNYDYDDLDIRKMQTVSVKKESFKDLRTAFVHPKAKPIIQQKQSIESNDLKLSSNSDAFLSSLTAAYENENQDDTDISIKLEPPYQPMLKRDLFASNSIFSNEITEGLPVSSEIIENFTLNEIEQIKHSSAVDSIPSVESVSISKIEENIDFSSATSSAFLVGDDGAFDFFWIDIAERPNGDLFLFGKARLNTCADSGSNNNPNLFASCCVMVPKMQRTLYVLPRDRLANDDGTETNFGVTFKDLHSEITSLLSKNKIPKFACKKVSRSYAFEVPNIPTNAEYLKVIYPFEFPALPSATPLKGKTFSHIFGINSSPVELFILKRKIMGPCWLSVKSPAFVKKNISWCRGEIISTLGPKGISVLSDQTRIAPNLTAMSISLRTSLNPKNHLQEIVAMSLLVYSSVPVDSPTPDENQKPSAIYSAIRPLDGSPLPFRLEESLAKEQNLSKVEILKTEKALLNYFIAMIQRNDPDILIGHNMLGFELGVLISRLKACKVDLWSKIGRLNWKTWPKIGGTSSSFLERQIVCGRLICDTYLSAKEHVRSKNYSLETLAASQLNMKRKEFDFMRIKEYTASSNGVAFLTKHAQMDAYMAALLAFKLLILPLTKQLSNLAGNLWSRTLAGSRAERNEYLLMHEFHNTKYILPDKATNSKFNNKSPSTEGDEDNDESAAASKTGKRKAAYSGGLVLEPKKGFYDKLVLLLDFNSLYPSIIQEFNICFTTVERDYSSYNESLPEFPDKSIPQGLLPKILGNLVARRRSVKQLMKNPSATASELAQFEIRQKALKLTANSMYGCLGFTGCRFYCKPLASLITFSGRNILQDTVNLAQETLKLDVLYGDTDSIMIYSGTNNLAEAKSIGYNLKKTVNEKYKLLELEMDGIFSKLLLLKKKKYAALTLIEKPDQSIIYSLETKGLDLVRRDWCGISNLMSTWVLNRIMGLSQTPGGLHAATSVIINDESTEDIIESIHNYLTVTANQLKDENIFPIENFVINKNLTKEPEEYADGKTQPHVVVALRVKKNGLSTAVHAGDIIPYVICSSSNAEKDNNNLIAQRAFHILEVKKDPRPLDYEWYLSQQILPPLARLCEHLAGTDSKQLAECLGLDGKKYRTIATLKNHSFGNDEFYFSCHSPRNSTAPLKLKCPSCSSTTEYHSILSIENETPVLGFQCRNPACQLLMPSNILNLQLISSLNAVLSKYHECWMVCQEQECNLRTRKLSVYEKRCLNPGCKGKLVPEYSVSALHSQLLAWKDSFDIDKTIIKYCNHPRKDEIVGMVNRVQPCAGVLMNTMEQVVKCSSFLRVDLSDVFQIFTCTQLIK